MAVISGSPRSFAQALADKVDPPGGLRPLKLRPKQQIGSGAKVMLLGGRQSGKTAAGGEWMADRVLGDDAEYALVGPTFGQARDVMMEHPKSGLLVALARRGVVVKRGGTAGGWTWNRSIGELRHGHRVAARIDGAIEGCERIQGHSIAAYWLDELRLVPDKAAEKTLEESLEFALSGSEMPQRVLTSATRPTGYIKKLVKLNEWDVRWLPMVENEANLPAAYFEQMMAQAGTRRGRQEVGGELLEDIEGALTKRAWWDLTTVAAGPDPGQIHTAAVGVDPGEPGPQRSQALAVAHRTADRHLWLTRAERTGDTPTEFLRHAVRLAHGLGATLVVEKNWLGAAGMELLESIMREIGIRVPYEAVMAKVGKMTRAEPVAHAVEVGTVHVTGLGGTEMVVDDFCSYDGTGESPHVLDAAVYALLCLMGGGYSGITDSVVPWDDPAAAGAIPWSEVA